MPPAVYSHWIVWSASSVTQVWKHQNSLSNLTLSVQCKDLAFSLHSLLHIDPTSSPKKETSPRWPFGLMWTNTGGAQSASLQVAHWDWSWTCLEYVLMWECPSMENVVTSAPLLGHTLCPPIMQFKSYICRWRLSPGTPAEKVKKDVIVRWVNITAVQPSSSPLTSQVTQTKKWDAKWSISQVWNGKLKCSWDLCWRQIWLLFLEQ